MKSLSLQFDDPDLYIGENVVVEPMAYPISRLDEPLFGAEIKGKLSEVYRLQAIDRQSDVYEHNGRVDYGVDLGTEGFYRIRDLDFVYLADQDSGRDMRPRDPVTINLALRNGVFEPLSD